MNVRDLLNAVVAVESGNEFILDRRSTDPEIGAFYVFVEDSGSAVVRLEGRPSPDTGWAQIAELTISHDEGSVVPVVFMPCMRARVISINGSPKVFAALVE